MSDKQFPNEVWIDGFGDRSAHAYRKKDYEDLIKYARVYEKDVNDINVADIPKDQTLPYCYYVSYMVVDDDGQKTTGIIYKSDVQLETENGIEQFQDSICAMHLTEVKPVILLILPLYVGP